MLALRSRIVASALLASVLLVMPRHGAAEVGDLVADAVIGQSTFDDAVAAAIGPNTFGVPKGIAIDRSVTPNRVYVSDATYHRVLGWSDVDALVNGAPADIVIGQPDAFSWGCNHASFFGGVPGAPTDTSLCGPAGLAVDAAGNLWVADSDNCRVLEFDDPFATDVVADRVLGQNAPGYQGCGVAADHLYEPAGVAVDASGNVFVADTLNCRVLEFDDPRTTDAIADRVYGQSSFTGRDCGAASTYFPAGVSVDANERLYVAGQYTLYAVDSALTNTHISHTAGNGLCNPGGESSSSTCGLLAAVPDDAGRLYVADSGNNRVLAYDQPFVVAQAARVYGQPAFGGTSDLFHDACNTGGPSATSLCLRKVRQLTLGGTYDEAGAVAIDGSGRLWVADGLNDRVLRYDDPLASSAATVVLGQPSMASIRQPVFPVADPKVALWESLAVVLDTSASRLLVYLNQVGFRDTPIAVIGQPDFVTAGCNANGLGAGSLCAPQGVTVDANGDLWVADTGNNRVLRFAQPWLQFDQAARRYVVKTSADAVFGQPDASSNGCGTGATGLCAPSAIASDPIHDAVFIADTGNNRILRHDNALADTIADGVLGQPDLTSTRCGTSPTALCEPEGLALDLDGALWIADTGNSRVLLYPRGENAAELALGQPDLTSSLPGAGAGGLNGPSGVSVDRGGNLYVADRENNRVLEYDTPRTTDGLADRVFGQPDFVTTDCAVSDKRFCRPSGVAHRTYYDDSLAVADGGNARVLLFDAPFCIQDFKLTAANRKDRTLRSAPLKAKVKIVPGTGGDVLTFTGANVILEQDDFTVSPEAPPLLTLSTPNGVVYRERVPDLSNLRLGATTETWGTKYLKGERDVGIDEYVIKEKWYDPANGPQYLRDTYKGRAVGLDLPAITSPTATWRVQWSGTCFTTDLTCAAGFCKPAK